MARARRDEILEVDAVLEEEGLDILFLLPHAIAFVGLFVAFATAPGLASAVIAAIVLLAVSVGAVILATRDFDGVGLLFLTVVPAVMLGFLLIPLQSWLTGWLAPLACDPAHPILTAVTERVSRGAGIHQENATLIAQVCVTPDGGDPQMTLLPGLIWAGILLVWLAVMVVVGVFVAAWRRS